MTYLFVRFRKAPFSVTENAVFVWIVWMSPRATRVRSFHICGRFRGTPARDLAGRFFRQPCDQETESSGDENGQVATNSHAPT